MHQFSLVTTRWGTTAEELLQHDRDRGTMERGLGDFKGAFQPTLTRATPSEDEREEAAAFATRAASFQLCLMAHGLLHTLREDK